MTGSDEIWVCGSSPMPWRFDAKYPTAPLGCPPKDQVFMKFNTDGKLLQLWTVPKAGDGKEQPGECNWLHCMALDSKGSIYAGDNPRQTCAEVRAEECGLARTQWQIEYACSRARRKGRQGSP
jgi:hypothetical protein